MDAKQLKEGDFFEVTGSVFNNIKESWEAVKLNIATFAVLLVIPALLAFGVLALAFIPAVTGKDAGAASAVLIALFGLLAVLIIALIIAPAIVLTQLASVVGKKIEPREAFNAGKKYVVSFVVLGFLSVIAIVLGLLLLIIPGLLAMFFLSLSAYILIDKDLSAIDSMKASYKLTQEYWAGPCRPAWYRISMESL